MRDNGPIFFKDLIENKEKIMSAIWTEWGYHDYQITNGVDDQFIPSRVGKELGILCESFPFASEGGDREFNGKGSLIVCKEVELDRNPGKSQADLEELYKQYFNVTNIIWLKHCLPDDLQTFNCPIPNTDFYTCIATGGHVDEYARFVSHNTILLAEVHSEERHTVLGSTTHQLLEENFQILSNVKDQDGQPFKIVRIPLPPPIIETVGENDGVFKSLKNLRYKTEKPVPERVRVLAAASYCNFLISNGIILLPKYYKEGRSLLFKQTDDTAKEILQSLFPEREVIQIAAEAINFGGGGIHCITQHQLVIQ